MLSPVFCSRWDANHLWLQWVADSGPVEIAARYRTDAEWEDWQEIKARRADGASWLVHQTLREDSMVQVRARSLGDQIGEWELATAAEFIHARALFEIQNTAAAGRFFSAGTVFHALVDQAALAYRLDHDLSLPPEDSRRIHLKAVHASGYSQLDRENHFDRQMDPFLRVRNVAPTENDLMPLGRDWDHIHRIPMDVGTICFG